MKKKNIIISIILIILSITFTILVKRIDVKPIGPDNSLVGFASINETVKNLIGQNMTFYKITEYLGMIPIIMALIYVIIGLIQLIQRKSFLKIDKEIYVLGALYIIVLGLYIFFEKCIINYRPVLIDGVLEASYPSSHTLMSLCICGSSLLLNKKLFSSKIADLENYLSIILIILIVLGRLLSGVHWFTDIIGGLIISSALLMSFYTIIQSIPHRRIRRRH